MFKIDKNAKRTIFGWSFYVMIEKTKMENENELSFR